MGFSPRDWAGVKQNCASTPFALYPTASLLQILLFSFLSMTWPHLLQSKRWPCHSLRSPAAIVHKAQY